MRTGNHSMVRLRDQRLHILRFASPQHENHSRLLHGNQFNYTIGEWFPPMALMRVGLVCPDGKNRVEQKNTLSCPWF